MLRGRVGLLERALKDKVSYATTLCRQISALITHCQLPPTEQLRETQMKVICLYYMNILFTPHFILGI